MGMIQRKPSCSVCPCGGLGGEGLVLWASLCVTEPAACGGGPQGLGAELSRSLVDMGKIRALPELRPQSIPADHGLPCLAFMVRLVVQISGFCEVLLWGYPGEQL